MNRDSFGIGEGSIPGPRAFIIVIKENEKLMEANLYTCTHTEIMCL